MFCGRREKLRAPYGAITNSGCTNSAAVCTERRILGQNWMGSSPTPAPSASLRHAPFTYLWIGFETTKQCSVTDAHLQKHLLGFPLPFPTPQIMSWLFSRDSPHNAPASIIISKTRTDYTGTILNSVLLTILLYDHRECSFFTAQCAL